MSQQPENDSDSEQLIADIKSGCLKDTISKWKRF